MLVLTTAVVLAFLSSLPSLLSSLFSRLLAEMIALAGLLRMPALLSLSLFPCLPPISARSLAALDSDAAAAAAVKAISVLMCVVCVCERVSESASCSA